jgi:hypothetical protein
MTEEHSSNMTIQRALQIAREMGNKGTVYGLISQIGNEMYDKLRTLGYIFQGATIDKDNKRVPVWKLTNKLDLFEEIKREPTLKEKRMGKILAQFEV